MASERNISGATVSESLIHTVSSAAMSGDTTTTEFRDEMKNSATFHE